MASRITTRLLRTVSRNGGMTTAVAAFPQGRVALWRGRALSTSHHAAGLEHDPQHQQQKMRPSLDVSTRRTMVTITQTSKNDTVPAGNDVTSSSSSTNMTAEPTTPTGKEEDGPPVRVTEACAKRIQELSREKGNENLYYLRVYVDAGGCSGFQYKFEMCDELEEDDVVLDGQRVVVDTTSLAYIQGSTIDYVQEMIRSAFCVVENPLSESACGCGSSFAMKNFASNPALD